MQRRGAKGTVTEGDLEGLVEKGAPEGGGGCTMNRGVGGGHAPLRRESISKCSSDTQHGIPSPPTAPAAQRGGVKTKIN